MSRLHNNYTSPHDVAELRFVTKSISLLALLTGLIYLRAVGVGGVTAVQDGQWNKDTIILFSLLTIATLGVLCAWRLEALGGTLAIISGIGVAVLAYLAVEDNKAFAAFAYSSPFLVAGGLSLACWWRARQAEPTK
jgi:hypothetical protein